MSTFHYLEKPGFVLRECQLKQDKKTGLWYRPNTSDKQMIKESNGDYPTVNCKGKIVFDLGANIGGFTCRAVREGCREVHAYEPDLYNVEVLVHNVNEELRLYKKGELDNIDVRIVDAAVSSSYAETLDFFINTSSISQCSGTLIPSTSKRKLKVTVKNKNFFDELEQWKPQIIKMDIEGGEYDLLDRPLPDYVEELAIELHGMNKATNQKMHDTFAYFHNSPDWETIDHRELDVFTTSPGIILAHFVRKY